VTVELTPAECLSTFTWAKRVADVVNDATITYGAGATVNVTDPTSIDARDSYPLEIGTVLAVESDAHALATALVGRRSTPKWQLPTVTVDLLRTITDPAKRARLLALSVGDRIAVSGLPPGGGPTTTDLYVEGVTELATRVASPSGTPIEDTPARDAWRLTFAVSTPAASGALIRWLDVPADISWDDVDPTLTWLSVAELADPNDLRGA
jgi:hypothetical protein